MATAGIIGLGYVGLPLDEALRDTDLALIVTAHPGDDHDLVVRRAPLVLDLRG